MIAASARSSLQVKTRYGGWATLAAGLPPPRVGESSTLLLAGVPPGAPVLLGPIEQQANGLGELALRLPTSDLAGHVGLLPVVVAGVPVGEIEIVPEKLTETAYRRLRADIEATWVRLAFDPDGFSATTAQGPRAVDLWQRIAACIEGIRSSPRTILTRQAAYGRLEQVRLAGSLRPGLLRSSLAGGIGLVDQVAATVDTPENRWVKEALLRLGRAAARQRDAAGVVETIARYLREEPFSGLPAPAGPLRPTHGMLRDPRYRVVWQALLELGGTPAAVVEGAGPLRLGLKSLPRLYEYWVFLQVLKAAEQRFGPPLGRGFADIVRRLGSNRARVELLPGTTVSFPGRVRVAFEPAIRAWGAAATWEEIELVPHPDRALAASLAVPDVVIAVGGPPPRLLIIDAKYVARGFVELEAALVHARYGRMLCKGVPVVEQVLAAHPHAGLAARWAGYGHLPFVPGEPPPELPWPAGTAEG